MNVGDKQCLVRNFQKTISFCCTIIRYIRVTHLGPIKKPCICKARVAQGRVSRGLNVPLDNLQSSLAVKTPDAEIVSLQITSLNGFRG